VAKNLVGTQVRVQWATGPAIHQARSHIVRIKAPLDFEEVTNFGDMAPRFEATMLPGGQIFLSTFIGADGLSSTAPPIPSGTAGTLTIDLDHYPSASASQTYTVKGLIVAMDIFAQSVGGSRVQKAAYVFVVTAHDTDAVGTSPWTVA
jgi:hypothetical protein